MTPPFSYFNETAPTGFSHRFLNLRKRRTDRILRFSLKIRKRRPTGFCVLRKFHVSWLYMHITCLGCAHVLNLSTCTEFEVRTHLFFADLTCTEFRSHLRAAHHTCFAVLDYLRIAHHTRFAVLNYLRTAHHTHQNGVPLYMCACQSGRRALGAIDLVI